MATSYSQDTAYAKTDLLKLDTRKTVLDLFFGNGVALAMRDPKKIRVNDKL